MSALAAAAALAVAVDRIGAWLGGEGLAARWVRGWTALWWLLAVTAVATRPAAAVAVGSVVAAIALGDALRSSRDRPRELVAGAAALLAGAPLWLAPPVFYDTLVYHLGLPWSWLVNPDNLGYGGNQKLGYRYAIDHGFDTQIIIQLLRTGACSRAARSCVCCARRATASSASAGSRRRFPRPSATAPWRVAYCGSTAP